MKESQFHHDESRETLDVRVDTPEREGLTGTTPSDVYSPVRDPEQITLAPDGRPLHYQPQWRKDFPIDWPQDHYVARRDFTKFMVLTSAAFAVGQLWIGMQNIWRRHRGTPPIRRIASLSSLPVGGILVFQYPAPHDDCLLIRAAFDKLLAYSQKCTHLSCAVYFAKQENRIECPCHEGYFSVKDGSVLQGPPPRPLPRIVLKREGDNLIASGVES